MHFVDIPKEVYTCISMYYSDLKEVLGKNPEKGLRFLLPDGDPVPPEFHVTEVGHVSKAFIDCGGTTRSAEACVLQLWVSGNDGEHRLKAAKLLSILEMAETVLPGRPLELEVEYETCALTQFPVLDIDATGTEVIVRLGRKHSDCLAKEACGLGSCGCATNEGACC